MIGVQARTDVTSTYLPNSTFAENLNGWTNVSNGTHYEGRCEYGKTTKLGTQKVTNVSRDKYGNTSGYAVATIGGWNADSYYTSDEITLPAGNYRLTFDVINVGDTKTIRENRFGWIPTSGTAVYNNIKSFEKHLWQTLSVDITLSEATAGKVSFGLCANANVGSGSTAWLLTGAVHIFKTDGEEGPASVSNPVDYTDLINQGSWYYDEDDTADPTQNSELTNNVNKGDWPYKHSERYRGNSGHYGKKRYQTVNVPAGVYIVKASCMSAAANGVEGASALADGTMNNAFFYANDKQTTYPLNNATSKYVSQVVTLTEAGPIEFGVKTAAAGANWSAIGCASIVRVAATYAEYIEEVGSQVQLVSTDITSGATATAGQWYRFSGAYDGIYKITAAEGTMISYTQEAAKKTTDDDFASTTIGSDGYSRIVCALGDFYFKTSATGTISIEKVSVAITPGTYYLKNVANNEYFAAGKTYGVHAITNVYGLDLVLRASAGGYSIDTKINNGGNKQFLNDLWCDGNALTYYFIDMGEGKYAITSDGQNYLASSGNGEECVSLAFSGAISDNKSYWQLVTPDALLASRLSVLSSATKANPVDATFLIGDANFNRNDLRKSSWSMVASNQNLSGGNEVNNCAESYHAVFTLSQTLSNAPAGKYGLTAQGFYRQDGSDNEHLPYFYFNGVENNIRTFPIKTGSEDSMSDASGSFTSGLYTIEEIEGNVTYDSPVVGAKLETNTNLWCIFDNFQLKYYGPNFSTITSTIARGDEMEAGKWYRIDFPKGTYTMSATNLANIVVTADPTILIEDGSSVTTPLESGDFDGCYYVKSSSTQALSWTCISGSIDEGTYYLKAVNDKGNRSEGVFLTRGGNYGTEGVTEIYGVAFQATLQPDGGYWLKTIDASLSANSDVYLASSGYTDRPVGEAFSWIFEKADDDNFYIKKTTSDYVVMEMYTDKYRPYGYIATTTNVADATRWQLMSKSEYNEFITARINGTAVDIATSAGLTGVTNLSELESALASNLVAIDYKEKINNADLSANMNGWTTTQYSVNGHANPTVKDGAAEVYNGTGGLRQTISGLPEGIYKVTLQACYRYGNSEGAQRAKDETNIIAFIGAETKSGRNTVQLKNWCDNTSYPNSRTAFVNAIETSDAYLNTLYVYVGEKEDLTLSVGLTGSIGSVWMPFRSWTLTQYAPKTASATIGATGWTTFSSVYPLDLSDLTASEGDVKAYYASATDASKVTMTSTDATVAAGEGLMLKGTPSATITIPVAASGDAIDGNKLVGCPNGETLSKNENHYLLYNNGGTAEFRPLTGNYSVTVPAGKAYLNVPASTGARLTIAFDGEDPTAINTIEAAAPEANALKDGKYLINGKIVLVKNGVKYDANGKKLN